MTTHSHPTEISHEQPPLPNQHFASWLRSQTTLFISQIVAVMGLVLFIAEEVYYVSHAREQGKIFDPLTIKLIVDYAHIVFMAVFIMVLIKVLDDNERGSYRVKLVYARVFKEPKQDEEDIDKLLETSKDQLRRFKRRFLWFWIGMLCLYIAFASQHTYEASLAPKKESAGKEVSLSFNVKSHEEEKFEGELSLSITDEARGTIDKMRAETDKARAAANEGHAEEKKPEQALHKGALEEVPPEGAQEKAPPKEELKKEEEIKNAPTKEELEKAPHKEELKKAPTKEELEKIRIKEEKEELERVHTKLIFACLSFFFNNFTLLFVFLCFLVLYIRPSEKNKEWKYWVGSVSVVAALTILCLWFLVLRWGEFTTKSAENYVSVFDALSGVINAVVLALLIARLDSRMVGLPAWLISILYSYAAVQPLFLVFEIGDSELLKTISTIVLVFVFIFKIYFFLIIFYALQTGKLLNYLTCFPILRERAGGHRAPDAERASFSARVSKSVHLGVAKVYEGARRGNTRASRRQRKAPRGRMHELEKSVKLHPRGMRARLGRIVSEGLRRYSLRVSEVIGWAAILYFFGSLISFQLLPEKTPWGGGLWGDALFIVSKILKPPPLVAFIIVVAQLVFVALMIVALHLISEDNASDRETVDKVTKTVRSIFDEPSNHEDSIKRGEAQMKKFKQYFLYFWYAIFALYAVFLLDPDIVYGSPLEGPFGHMLELMFFPSLEFGLASANLVCAFWCFAALYSPAFANPLGVRLKNPEMMRKHVESRHKRFEAKRKLLINYSTFCILLLITIYLLMLGYLGGPKLSERGLRDYSTVFDGVTGLLSAVVLALLIARMDSKLFSLPLRLIWMLFAYASIQSLFIAFAQNAPVLQMVKTSVLTTALGLKICFFLIVAHSLQSGRMLNYLVCFPLLKERVDSIFENQFEIRLARTEHDKFTYFILKKNRLHYSAAEPLDSREECDGAVKQLRGLMEKGESYGAPRHSSGTYWVEVRSGDKLLCESVPLRSAEEALDLIDESIGKVPYCKYNRL